MTSEAKNTVLITGANSGIGYQTVLALLQSSNPYKIFLGARSEEKANGAIKTLKEKVPGSNSELIPVFVDIESDESIDKLFERVQGETDNLDVLINNAGAQFDRLGASLGMTPREIFNKSWNVNVTGTHILTTKFAPLLINSTKGGRLLFLTSGLASVAMTEEARVPFNEPNQVGWPKDLTRDYTSYKSAKVGLNMVMRDWYKWLKKDNVKVWCINPGYVVTGLGGDKEWLSQDGAGDPSVSGVFIRSVIEGEKDQSVGKTVNAPNFPYYEDGLLPW